MVSIAVLGSVCVGFLWLPSAFKTLLGEFPVSGLERSTDSKLTQKAAALGASRPTDTTAPGPWMHQRAEVRGDMADSGHLQKHADSCNPHLCPFNCSSAASFRWKVDEMWSDGKRANICQL